MKYLPAMLLLAIAAACGTTDVNDAFVGDAASTSEQSLVTTCTIEVNSSRDAIISCPDGTMAIFHEDSISCDVLDRR